MRLAIAVAAVTMLVACGGSNETAAGGPVDASPAPLTAAPLTPASWSVAGGEVVCPGALSRVVTDFDLGIHVQCGWPCASYTMLTTGATPCPAGSAVELTVTRFNRVLAASGPFDGGWHLFSEMCQPGICR